MFYELIIIISPLLINGLLLYLYRTLITGALFYLLLPLTVIFHLVIYLILRGVLSKVLTKFYGSPKEGVFKIHSRQWESWVASTILRDNIMQIPYIFNIPINALSWIIKRVFNAKIGDAKIIAYCHFEPSLTEMGDGVIIGHNALIAGHLIEGDNITIKKVRIGNNVTIGACSIISPGVVIGDNTMIGAHSFVPKNAVLESNSVYVGIPVKKLKTVHKKMNN